MDINLLTAVEQGAIDRIEAAVRSGANVNARDDSGETVLSRATVAALGPERALACVRCLLNFGARVSEERPAGGLGTSVHRAATNGYLESLRELLSVDGRCAFGAFDDFGRSPLICAVEAGHIAEASLLLNAGADVDAHDPKTIGSTALAYAVENGNVAMVELLLSHGADPTVKGWMQLSALDRTGNWTAVGAPPDLKRIHDLLQMATERRALRKDPSPNQ